MQLKFVHWVEQFGIHELAQKLKVTDHAVRVWLRGENSPTSEKIIEIIRLSKGSLSFQEIFKETTRSKE